MFASIFQVYALPLMDEILSTIFIKPNREYVASVFFVQSRNYRRETRKANDCDGTSSSQPREYLEEKPSGKRSLWEDTAPTEAHKCRSTEFEWIWLISATWELVDTIQLCDTDDFTTTTSTTVTATTTNRPLLPTPNGCKLWSRVIQRISITVNSKEDTDNR